MLFRSFANYMRKAMMIVIDSLGPDDRLSIVLFDSDAHRLMELTYMSDRGRADARLMINQLDDGHATNIGAGLQEGAQVYLFVVYLCWSEACHNWVIVSFINSRIFGFNYTPLVLIIGLIYTDSKGA